MTDHHSSAAQSRERAARVLADRSRACWLHWGLSDYSEVLATQERLRAQRQADRIADTWLIGEHRPVITQGVRGVDADLRGPAAHGVPVVTIDRGGMTTIHNPGQALIYMVARTGRELTAQAWASSALLAAVRGWLAALWGVELAIERGRPGLFRDGRKAAAIGISVRGRVTMHGIAINLCNELALWRAIVPCGEPDTRPVTVSELLGRRVQPADLVAGFADWLSDYWGYDAVEAAPRRGG